MFIVSNIHPLSVIVGYIFFIVIVQESFKGHGRFGKQLRGLFSSEKSNICKSSPVVCPVKMYTYMHSCEHLMEYFNFYFLFDHRYSFWYKDIIIFWFQHWRKHKCFIMISREKLHLKIIMLSKRQQGELQSSSPLEINTFNTINRN